jgi:hypothetical protein
VQAVVSDAVHCDRSLASNRECHRERDRNRGDNGTRQPRA